MDGERRPIKGRTPAAPESVLQKLIKEKRKEEAPENQQIHLRAAHWA